MKGALERDHGRTAGVQARELDGVLDRLGPGVEERRARRPGDRDKRAEPLGELDVALVRDHREVRVEKPRRLLLHRFDHPWMPVTDVHAPHTAREVDERVAVDVGDRAARRLGGEHRQVDVEWVSDRVQLALEELP